MRLEPAVLRFAALSLTPCFSGVFDVVWGPEPLQRFVRARKPLKRLRRLRLAEHPAKAGLMRPDSKVLKNRRRPRHFAVRNGFASSCSLLHSCGAVNIPEHRKAIDK